MPYACGLKEPGPASSSTFPVSYPIRLSVFSWTSSPTLLRVLKPCSSDQPPYSQPPSLKKKKKNYRKKHLRALFPWGFRKHFYGAVLFIKYFIIFYQKHLVLFLDPQIGEELVCHENWREACAFLDPTRTRVALTTVRSGFHLLTGNIKVHLTHSCAYNDSLEDKLRLQPITSWVMAIKSLNLSRPQCPYFKAKMIPVLTS